MSRKLQPPVLSVSLVKTEPLTAIKNEPPESEIMEIDINDILDSSESDLKDIDIVCHPVCDKFIKSEILESYHCESAETQVLVKAENSLFIKTENISERNKTEDTSDKNVTKKGTGQAVVEVQASKQHSNALSKLETDKQSVVNFSKNLNGINVRSRKCKSPKKTDFVECHKTDNTTLWKKKKEKIKVIKALVIPVEAHEYTSLAKGKHVCNHCQHAYNTLGNVKRHIEKIHRQVTTMYQCPYCPYKSKWKHHIRNLHIVLKHKDTKDIEWFQCNLCEMKYKLKHYLTQHMKVHLTHKQLQDRLALREKRHVCDKCDYKAYRLEHLKRHNLVHLKPEETQYFYCYHCSYKCQRKDKLKLHIFRHFKNVEFKQGKRRGKRHDCDKCDYQTYRSQNLKSHKLIHLNPEEVDYFYCYHCSHKSKQKADLKKHIFRHHFKNVKQEKRHYCNKCDYKTYKNSYLKSHKLTHLKPEEIQYFYCYHCSHKAKRKPDLKRHIFRHFKNGQVRFDCYICNFMTSKRESITKHIKKHSKSEIKEGS